MQSSQDFFFSKENAENSNLFDDLTESYDHYRPGYPIDLYKKIIEISSLKKHDKIIEIGSGTGKGTLYFAQKGYEIICIEKGKKLCELCLKNLKKYSNVSIKQGNFHKINIPPKCCDLVFSAQAFHWLDDRKYKETSSILKDSGHLALFWNNESIIEGNFNDQVSKIFTKYTDIVKYPSRNLKKFIPNQVDELKKNKYYRDIKVFDFAWAQEYDIESFLGMLNTYTGFLALGERIKACIISDIKQINKGHDEKVIVDFYSILFIVRKNQNIEQCQT